jgi:hypothetical protein
MDGWMDGRGALSLFWRPQDLPRLEPSSDEYQLAIAYGEKVLFHCHKLDYKNPTSEPMCCWSPIAQSKSRTFVVFVQDSLQTDISSLWRAAQGIHPTPIAAMVALFSNGAAIRIHKRPADRTLPPEGWSMRAAVNTPGGKGSQEAVVKCAEFFQNRSLQCMGTMRVHTEEIKTTVYRKELPFPHPWQVEMLSILSKPPDDRTIMWVYEETGKAGKSGFCKHVVTCYPELNALLTNGKASDMLNQTCEYFKLNQKWPTIIFVDIPRSHNSDFMSYDALEQLKNMCFYSGKYEGGMVAGPEPHLVVFSNKPPELAKFSEDRWAVGHIGDDRNLTWCGAGAVAAGLL